MVNGGGRVSAFERWTALLACAAVLAVFVSIETRLAGQPFDGRHEDNAVAFMGAARNHLRYGFSRTLGQDLQEPHTGWYGDLSVEHRYLHHPPGLSLTLAASTALVGDTRATGRLTAAFFTLFSLLAMFCGAYWFIGGAWSAALAGAVFTLTPLNAFFGRSVDFQTFTLPFLLWSAVLLVMYRRSGRAGFRNLAILVACVGGLFDWDVYFWILTAAIYEMVWPPPGTSRWRAALPWAIAGASMFTLVVTQIVLIAGSSSELLQVMLKWMDGKAAAAEPAHAGRLLGWFPNVFRWAWQLAVLRLMHLDFTGPLVLAALAFVLYGIVRLIRGDRRITDAQRLVVLSATPGILYLLAVPASLGHEYVLMPLSGAVCWAATDAVARIPGAKRAAAGVALVLCVWWTAGPWVEMYYGACFAPYRVFCACGRPVSMSGFGKITYRTPQRGTKEP